MLPKSRQLREKKNSGKCLSCPTILSINVTADTATQDFAKNRKEKCSIKRAGNNHSDLISLMPIYRKEICSIKRAQYNNIQLGNI
jgi:hypothetical protein